MEWKTPKKRGTTISWWWRNQLKKCTENSRTRNRSEQIPNEKYKVFGAMVRVLGFRFSRAALSQRQCILSINAWNSLQFTEIFRLYFFNTLLQVVRIRRDFGHAFARSVSICYKYRPNENKAQYSLHCTLALNMMSVLVIHYYVFLFVFFSFAFVVVAVAVAPFVLYSMHFCKKIAWFQQQHTTERTLFLCVSVW